MNQKSIDTTKKITISSVGSTTVTTTLVCLHTVAVDIGHAVFDDMIEANFFAILFAGDDAAYDESETADMIS